MKWFLLVVAAFFFTMGITSYFFENTYEGKEVFYSEEEYGEFKLACAAPDVRLGNIEVLSSEPPIVVEFQVESYHQFEYGEKSILHKIVGMVFIVFGGVVTITSIVFAIQDKKKKIMEVNDARTR
jgi:hypothetical protein